MNILSHSDVNHLSDFYTEFGCPGGSDSEEFACNPGDSGSVPELESSPGGGNGNSLQDSCLGNFMDRGAWQATVQGGHKDLDMTEQLTHTDSTIRILRYCANVISSFYE